MELSVWAAQVWAPLREFVLRQEPEMARRLHALGRESFTGPGLEHARQAAVAAYLDLDLGNPREAGDVRAAMQLLASDGAASADSQRMKERLAPVLEWLGEPGTLPSLLQGPVKQAVSLVQRKARPLKGLRAYRFLDQLGLPVATPDAARQRFLFRYGLVEEVGDDSKSRRVAADRMDELAASARVSPGEVSLVLGVFAGAAGLVSEKATICGPVPNCRDCAIGDGCLYRRMRGKERAEPVAESALERLREKVQAKGSAADLDDAELLSIALGASRPEDRMITGALEAAGSLREVARLSFEELLKLPGMGPAKAVQLKVLLELGQRMAARGDEDESLQMDHPRKVFARFQSRFLNKKQEEFHVLHLDAKLRVIREVHITTGILTASPVHPREIFAGAIRDSAYAVVFVHNHPSGDPTPSDEDLRETRRLMLAGELLGIRALDHVVIGHGRWHSIAKDLRIRDETYGEQPAGGQ